MTRSVEPLIALGREAHHPSLSERFAEAPPAPDNPTAVEAMAHRLKTLEGRKLYAQRKHTPEPVFGIIKSVLGFRQFLLRGLDHVRGEWNLVTLAWNLKRMFVLSPVIPPGSGPPTVQTRTAAGRCRRFRGQHHRPDGVFSTFRRRSCTQALARKSQSDRLLDDRQGLIDG